jgi:hypothetical protein
LKSNLNRCLLCERNSGSLVCGRHSKAYENLLQGYELWRKAKGLSWKDYLKELSENPYAGAWVRHLAKKMLELGIDRPKT